MRSHEEQQRDRIYDLEQENARLRAVIGCMTCGGRIAANALLSEREALRATQAMLDGLRTLSASHRNLT